MARIPSLALSWLLCGLAFGCATGPGLTQPSQSSLEGLKNPEVGYSLLYPSDWQLKGQVVATSFATDAECQSVEVVDFQPPEGSGPAAVVLHSFVQICARRLSDGLTLDDFMRQTYGDALAEQFQITELGGVAAYQTVGDDADTTIFLQASDYRVQLAASVVAEPAKRPERLSQVRRILDSFLVQS